MSVKTILVGGFLYGLVHAAACVTTDKRDVTRSVHIQQQTMAGKPVPVVGCPDDFNSEQCSKYSSKQSSLFSSLSAASTSSKPASTPATTTTFPITSTVSISMSTSKLSMTVPAPIYNETGVYTVYSDEMELTFRHVTGNNDDLTTCIIDPSSVQETASDTIAVTCADGNVWEFYVEKLHVDSHARNRKRDHDDDHGDHDHDENAKTMASDVWDCFHNGNCKRAASTPAVERATMVVNAGEQKSILISMIDDCSSFKSLAARATTSTPRPVVIVTSTTTMDPPVVPSTPTSSSQAFTLPPPKPSTTMIVPAVTIETVTVQDTMMFPDTVTVDVTKTIDPTTLLPSITETATVVAWPAGFSLRPTTEQMFMDSVVNKQMHMLEDISSSAPLPAPGAAVRGGLLIFAGLAGVGAFML